jgi:putative ABC transport system permease protein
MGNKAYFQPLKKIHFHFDPGSRTALTHFYTFSVVAVFILLIACINFVNLTTARAARRAREVGLRKVVGASRGNLTWQFLGESLFLTILSFVLGLSLVSFFAPLYSQLLDKNLNIIKMISPVSIAGFIGLILVVGMTAGAYPSFYLFSFQPARTLKGEMQTGRGSKKFRDILVVFQFAISVTLIICTILIQNQIRFMRKAELGYEKENILVIDLSGEELRSQTKEMKERLLSIPGIMQAGASSEVPHRGFTQNGYMPEGYSTSLMFYALDIDELFLDTYGIKVVEGRNFNKEFSHLLPFEYFFLDDAFERLYKSEERFQRIFLYFSVLAICIALLGLFSLSAYTPQQKSKQIGIRKVLGAKVPD